MASKKKTPVEKLTVRDNRPAQLRNSQKSKIIATDVKREEALDLYLQHNSYRTIARKLGVDVHTASDLVNHQYEQRLASATQKAAMVRDRQSAQYDEIIERWMPLALSEELDVSGTKQKSNGDIMHINLEAWEAAATATDKVLKAMEGKAKIHGLQMTKIEMKSDPIAQDLFKQVQDLVESMKEKRANAIEV